MPNAPSAARPSELRVRHWNDSLAWVDVHSDSSWVFRGLGDPGFALLAGAGRIDTFSGANEKVVLEIFERRATEFMDLSGLSEWDKLAIAQHHGLPTRFLDWTTNPLVAAYFAVSATPGPKTYTDDAGMSFRATPAAAATPARIVAFRVRTQMVIDTKSDVDPFERRTIGFVLPRSLTTRIVTQGGLFSFHPEPNLPWTAPLEVRKNVFDIPGHMRSFFQRRLFYLGVDPQRIMGGLDGIGGRLNWQYSASIGLGAVR